MQQRSLRRRKKKKETLKEKKSTTVIHRRREPEQVGDFETKSKQAKDKDKGLNVGSGLLSLDRDEWIKKPSCSWELGERFVFDGVHGECVVTPPCEASVSETSISMEKMSHSSEAKRPTWYSLEEGKCSIFAANATHLEFNIHHAETGIFFTGTPHKYVLDPQESDYFSDLSHLKDKAVAVLVRGEGEGIGGEIFHVGVLDMTTEGNGLLVGKRMHGDDLDQDHDASTIYSVVIGSVERLRSWSAAAVGMCTSDGKGRVSIEVDDFVRFQERQI